MPVPRQCTLCRTWSPQALCAQCLQRFAAPVPRCVQCGLRIGSADRHCGECLRDPPPFQRCFCAGDYAFPWDRLITAFKFHGRVELAVPLALALRGAIERDGAPAVDLVVPVPLSRARLAERGHNQAWEIARRIAAALGLRSDATSLLRLRDTAHQVGLTREERARNLRGAVCVEPTRATDLRGRRIALVDDVLTTGVTAAATASVLLQAGAASVQLWVIARTAAPAEQAG